MRHGTHVAVRGPQLAGRSPLSPATIRVSGIELKLSNLSDNSCLDLLSHLDDTIFFLPLLLFLLPFIPLHFKISFYMCGHFV